MVGKWLRRAVVMGAFPILTGCYTYADTSLDALSPGLQTRLRLDEDGFGRVVNQAASSGVSVQTLDLGTRGVIGRLTTIEPGTMTVELRGAGGAVFDAEIPTQAVQEAAVRSFSPRRTLGAVAGVALLSGLLYTGTVGGDTEGPADIEPENIILRLFSLVIR